MHPLHSFVVGFAGFAERFAFDGLGGGCAMRGVIAVALVAWLMVIGQRGVCQSKEG
jgi:hypothetical protein